VLLLLVVLLVLPVAAEEVVLLVLPVAAEEVEVLQALPVAAEEVHDEVVVLLLEE
jgi:hypothetical protein